MADLAPALSRTEPAESSEPLHVRWLGRVPYDEADYYRDYAEFLEACQS